LTDSWPFSGWPTIVAVLERLALDEKPVDKRTLPNDIELSRGSVNGAIPAMKAMGLIEPNGHRRFLKITDMGRALARAIRREDRDTIHSIGLDAISKYPHLATAVRVLSANPSIPTVELARVVAGEHGKEWPKEKTYSHVGNAMKSILIGFSLAQSTRRRRTPALRHSAQARLLERTQSSRTDSPFLPPLHELIVELHRFHIYDTGRLLEDAREHGTLEKVLARLGEVAEGESLRIRIDHIKHFIDRAFETGDSAYLKDAGWIAHDLEVRFRSSQEKQS